MCFTSPRRNLYASSDGFEIEVLGCTGLCYREAGREMSVYFEVLTRPSGMAVYKHIIKKWGPTHENVPVTDSDQGEFQPDDIQWMISLSYATRRADSIQAAKEILLNAEPKFPKEPAIKYNLACYFCQMGDIKTATSYLKKAFEIDLNWRMTALEDKDLKSLWESF